jgi:outer membrane protein assembly factor BamE (lipoprotein component of BamABCDE complex)
MTKRSSILDIVRTTELANPIMKFLIPLVLSVATLGCVTSSKNLAQVSQGMPKHEVIQILGPPASVSVHQGYELMRYQLSGTNAPILNPNHRNFAEGYTVKFKSGKVVAFGRDDEFETINVKSAE